LTEKIVTAECSECESIFELNYSRELVSEDIPCFCPFCGEKIEDVQEEEVEDDDDLYDDEAWR
jgi:DNA-directed RNA polymerase subunit RPC12/RpoP